MADVARLRQERWDGRGSFVDWLADNCPCPVCRTSSPDRDRPRVMTGITAMPDESLIGLVARTCARNWIGRLRSLLGEISPAWHVHFNLATREDIDFVQLAHAARIAPHEIEARRYLRVEIQPSMEGLVFHGACVPAYDIDLRARRVAPSWLRDGYHSALAHHRLVTHCPNSGEILFDQCPRCGTDLTWTKCAFEICGTCGLDIASHDGDRVPRRILLATRPIIDIVHPHPARHAAARSKLHPMLAKLDRGDIFELGWRMGCVLTGQGLNARDNAHTLSVERRLAILEQGASALTNWPDSVTAALRGETHAGSGVARASFAHQVRLIASARNSWPPLRAAMLEAAPGTSFSIGSAVKATLDKGVNSREAEQALGVSQAIVQRLRGTPHLQPVLASGTVNAHMIFEAGGLAPLRALLDDRVDLGSVAERMDLSRNGVEQLACLGEIEIYDHDAIRTAFRSRQVRRSDFLRLKERLDGAARDLDPRRTLPIHRAMRTIGGREKPWAPTVLAMLCGALPFAIDRSRDDRFMDRVSIAEEDVGELGQLEFDHAEHPDFAFENAINRRDVEEVLNVHPKAMGNALAEAVVTAQIDGSYDRATILGLARTFISPSEMLARCTPSGRSLPPPFRGARRLVRVSALGWHRDEAERRMSKFDRYPRTGH